MEIYMTAVAINPPRSTARINQNTDILRAAPRRTKLSCCKKASIIAGNVLITASSCVIVFGAVYMSFNVFVRGVSHDLGMARVTELAHQRVQNGLIATCSGALGYAIGHILKW
jgi:hypothetical protein